MPSYSIRAVDPSGKLIEDILAASDQGAAIEAVRDRGLTPLKIELARGKVKAGATSQARSGVSRSDLSFIFLQLGILVQAGLALDRAFGMVSAMLKKPAVREELEGMRGTLLEGQSLSDYVTARPKTYPTFVAGAIRAGEASGSLDASFEQIGKLLERQMKARRAIVDALIYPSLLVAGSLVSILVLLTVVLPKFEPLFASSGAELPFATRALLATSRGVIDALPAAALVMIVGAGGLRVWLQKPGNRTELHRVLLKLPVVGRLQLKAQLAQFAHVMTALLKAGMPVLTAMATARLSLSNLALSRSFQATGDMVRDGRSLSQSLAAHSDFPDLFVQIVGIGEEAARLEQSFAKVGEIYEDEVAAEMQKILGLIAPATTIGVGIMIAGIIAAVLSAVMRINDLAFT